MRLANAALPRPPLPPAATTNLSPAWRRSASCSPGCLGLPCGPLASKITVPTGTGRIRSAPFEPSLVVSQAHGAASSLAVGHETVIQQAVGVLVGHEDHGTAITAVATVRSRQRLVFFPTDAGGTVAAVAALHMDGHAIDEITHVSTLIVCSKRSDYCPFDMSYATVCNVT